MTGHDKCDPHKYIAEVILSTENNQNSISLETAIAGIRSFEENKVNVFIQQREQEISSAEIYFFANNTHYSIEYHQDVAIISILKSGQNPLEKQEYAYEGNFSNAMQALATTKRYEGSPAGSPENYFMGRLELFTQPEPKEKRVLAPQ